MSFIESILNFLSSLFKEKEQSAPEPEPEPQIIIKDDSVEAYIPSNDIRVSQTNKGLGLVTKVVEDTKRPFHYTVYHQNGMVRDLSTGRSVQDLIQFGIDLSVNTHLEYVISDIRNNRSLSEYSEQEIFDAKVYLGKYEIVK